MKLIFDMQINIEVFYKLVLSFWVCVAKHAQSTQNNKFAISLQYLKENVKDEVDFLHNVILLLLICMMKHSQSTQSNKFAISLQYPKKEVRNGVHVFACK